MQNCRPWALPGYPAHVADKPDGPLAGRLLAVIEAEQLSGSPVAGGSAADRQATAEPALAGPLMTDYRYLAAKLAAVLADPAGD